MRKGPMLPPSRPQDWPEDHEQGDGSNSGVCSRCGLGFYGHKLRGVCLLCASEREKVAGSSRAEGQAQDAQAEGPGSPSSAEQSLRAMRLALEVALEVLIQRDILLPGWEQDWGSDPAVAQCIEVAKRNAIQLPGHVRGKADVRSDPTERQRRLDEFAKAALTGMLADPRFDATAKILARAAFDCAETMLAESDRRAAGAKEGE